MAAGDGDQLLTGPRVRLLVGCPVCGVKRTELCFAGAGGEAAVTSGHRGPNHQQRVQEARALLREQRMGPIHASGMALDGSLRDE